MDVRLAAKVECPMSGGQQPDDVAAREGGFVLGKPIMVQARGHQVVKAARRVVTADRAVHVGHFSVVV